MKKNIGYVNLDSSIGSVAYGASATRELKNGIRRFAE